MKKIITGLFAIAAFTFSAAAQDQSNPDQRKWKDEQGNHRDGKGRGMRGMEQLNLTDAQKLQMKSINEDFKNRMQLLNQNDNMLVKDQKAQRKSLMDERNNKISAILSPEQRTQFEQLRKQGGKDGNFAGRGDGNRGQRNGDRMGQRGGDRMEQMKTTLGLSDDQVAKIKAGGESFRQRGKAIRENQSLTEDQKKQQFETLQKEREANLKSYLTAAQIAKLDQMKQNRGDGKNKEKGDGWKEKRKAEDGKEKIKVKTT